MTGRRLSAWAAGLRRYGDATEIVESGTVERCLPEGVSLTDPLADRAVTASWTDAAAAYIFRERVCEAAHAQRRHAPRPACRRRRAGRSAEASVRGWRNRRLGAALAAVLLLALSGCTLIARKGYQAATDERSLETQRADIGVVRAVKRSLRSARAAGAGDLEVFSRNGVVVLAGSTAPDSALAVEAVQLAAATEGVTRVETYFVPVQRARGSDFAIKQKIHAKLIGDGALRAGQVDMSVIGGHVVLVGVVDQPDKVDRIVAHARATDGVQATRSFIQVAP